MKIYQIDAFTAKPFTGNPAAVCIIPQAIDAKKMQQIAMEMNLSETAFAYPTTDGHYHLRWFTPVQEVDLCGHGTLATAKVLFETSNAQNITFETKSGLLFVEKRGKEICLDFPIDLVQPYDAKEIFAKAFADVQIKACFLSQRMRKAVFHISSAEKLRTLRPNFHLLKKLEIQEKLNGSVVTAQCDDGKYDFISRFFVPSGGIDEDPVTGAAHTVLGPYWSNLLNKKELCAYQASPRGGEMKLELCGERIKLIGQALIMMESKLHECY